jgi:hypothetical protein
MFYAFVLVDPCIIETCVIDDCMTDLGLPRELVLVLSSNTFIGGLYNEIIFQIFHPDPFVLGDCSCTNFALVSL